jgi:hypothetical protein
MERFLLPWNEELEITQLAIPHRLAFRPDLAIETMIVAMGPEDNINPGRPHYRRVPLRQKLGLLISAEWRTIEGGLSLRIAQAQRRERRRDEK